MPTQYIHRPTPALRGEPLTDTTGRRSAARLRHLARIIHGWPRQLAEELADRAEIRDRLQSEMQGAVGVKVRAVVRVCPMGQTAVPARAS